MAERDNKRDGPGNREDIGKRAAHLGYGKGNRWARNRSAGATEDMVGDEPNPEDAPAGTAGFGGGGRREGSARRKSLDSGTEPNSATDASHPMTGTSRRSTEPGSGSLHGGYDSVSPGPQETDPDATQPRETGGARRSSRSEQREGRMRSLLSRLNPFSRDQRP